jgi:hypothetical protein
MKKIMLVIAIIFATSRVSYAADSTHFTAYGDTWLAAFSEALLSLAASRTEDGEGVSFTNASEEVNVNVDIGNININYLYVAMSLVSHDTKTEQVYESTTDKLTYKILFADKQCELMISGHRTQHYDDRVSKEADLNEYVELVKNNCSISDLLKELKQQGITAHTQIVGPHNHFSVILIAPST